MSNRTFLSRAGSVVTTGALVAATACADASAPIAPRQPTVSLAKNGPNALPQRGRIVFKMWSADVFSADLYSINEDGSGLLRLTYTPTITEDDPAASRDGKKIAYIAEDLASGATSEVGVMNADGSQAKALTKLGLSWSDYGDMDWSPDGKRIAIALRPGATGTSLQEWDIYFINVSSGAVTQVTSLPGEEGSPSWSPDGSRIAFHRKDDNGVFQIYTMKADGTDITQFMSCLTACAEPAWAPDGATIAVYHPFDLQTRMHKVADPNSTAGFVPGRYAAWAPDAAKLVFHQIPSLGLSTALFTGSEAKPLITSSLTIEESTWLRK